MIAALLAGTGIAFLDVLDGPETEKPSIENDIIRICVFVVELNFHWLVTLSIQLYYLRQILAKDVRMFKPFVAAMKDTRYYALKGVL